MAKTLKEKMLDLLNDCAQRQAFEEHDILGMADDLTKNYVELWHIDDVMKCAEELEMVGFTEKEAASVLDDLEGVFDANNGTNWEVIKTVLMNNYSQYMPPNAEPVPELTVEQVTAALESSADGANELNKNLKSVFNNPSDLRLD